MKINREMVKNLITISDSVEEADKVIEENYGFKTIGEKIAFLKGMFDVNVVCTHDVEGIEKDKSDKMTYFSLLHTILITQEF